MAKNGNITKNKNRSQQSVNQQLANQQLGSQQSRQNSKNYPVEFGEEFTNNNDLKKDKNSNEY